MTVSEKIFSKSNKPYPKKKDSVKQSKKQEEVKIPTKVVIRRLPPSLGSEELLQFLDPLPDHNYFYFVPADKSLGPYAFSRAYINFSHVDDIFIFCQKFDGYVFLDNQGGEYPALVELAPYQKISKRKGKTDSKKNTISTDSEYMRYIERLENPEPEQVPSIEMRLEEIETKELQRAEKENQSTPLLDFILRKREERLAMVQRQREERKMKDIERRKFREDVKRNRFEHTRKDEIEKNSSGRRGKSYDYDEDWSEHSEDSLKKSFKAEKLQTDSKNFPKRSDIKSSRKEWTGSKSVKSQYKKDLDWNSEYHHEKPSLKHSGGEKVNESSTYFDKHTDERKASEERKCDRKGSVGGGHHKRRNDEIKPSKSRPSVGSKSRHDGDQKVAKSKEKHTDQRKMKHQQKFDRPSEDASKFADAGKDKQTKFHHSKDGRTPYKSRKSSEGNAFSKPPKTTESEGILKTQRDCKYNSGLKKESATLDNLSNFDSNSETSGGNFAPKSGKTARNEERGDFKGAEAKIPGQTKQRIRNKDRPEKAIYVAGKRSVLRQQKSPSGSDMQSSDQAT